MKDGYGEPITVAEDEDLLYLSKSTFGGLGTIHIAQLCKQLIAQLCKQLE